MNTPVQASEAIDWWADKVLTAEQFTRKRYVIDKLYRLLRERRFSDIRLEDILEYIEAREEENVQGCTIQRELSIISKYIRDCQSYYGIVFDNPVVVARKWLYGSGRLVRNPARNVRVNDEALNQILGCSVLDWLSHVCHLALRTTMRQSEIANMKPDNICFENKTVFVPWSKNGDARYIPMSDNTRLLLLGMPAIPDDPREIGCQFRAAKIKAARRYNAPNLLNIRFHDLRREGVCRLLELGLEVNEVQLYSGHKTLKAMEGYIILDPEKIADEVSLLNKSQAAMNELVLQLKTCTDISEEVMTDIVKALLLHTNVKLTLS